MLSREVKRADRSPLRTERWRVELICGHKVWVVVPVDVSSKKRLRRLFRPRHCVECAAS